MADIPGFTMEVIEKYGVLSESAAGWTKELRFVSWNGREPRYDLREWAPGDRKSSRGVTMSLKEIRELQEILMDIDFPDYGVDVDLDASSDDEAYTSSDVKAEVKEGGAKRKAG